MAILFLIVIICISVIILIWEMRGKETPNDDVSTRKVTIIIDEKTINKAKGENMTAYHKRMEYLYKRDINRMRKKRVWAMLRFLKSIESITTSENFYDLDKAICDFQNAKARLLEKDYNPAKEEIEIAIRFCTISYAQGRCFHQLTLSEMHDVRNWETYYIYDSAIMDNTATSFKAYWDSVLANYKRPSAKINRINYLIEHLNEMNEKETLQQFSNFKEHIANLISHYNSFR
uniref:Uncharacterized protein n=1 Tax=Myoviridae sp. ctt8G1 TaxID=2827713 RepID=A0A8S5TGN7_9CAUD|nr:MAG TPA: hypothetical protein [Myoviridae sp. ctt8G1]